MRYEWTKDLETGHSVIDSQHKELIAAVNGLMDAIESGKGGEAVSSSLNFLNDYTIKHFFEEEMLQQKYNYPDYPNHKKIHDSFKTVIRDLKVREMWKGSSGELVNEVRDKIGGWLVTHIKGQDVKVAAYIRSVSK
ncbi:MAG: bacteriohemerythrin [Treponema sp.]|jgi:hemerythrin|nr:bacteriohemerythrin [Treponema sp.]